MPGRLRVNQCTNPEIYRLAALFDTHTKKVIRIKLKKFSAEQLDLFRNDFRHKASVSEMLHNLGWQSLDSRRQDSVLVLVYTQEGSLWSIVLRCDDHTGIFTCDGCARDPYFYVPAETQSYVIKLSCSRKVLAASGD